MSRIPDGRDGSFALSGHSGGDRGSAPSSDVSNLSAVIPGPERSEEPESITTAWIMDSGLAPFGAPRNDSRGCRAPRNDGGGTPPAMTEPLVQRGPKMR